MIFQHTHEWIFAPSPHTGELKTMTSRLVKPGEWLEDHGLQGFVQTPAVVNGTHGDFHWNWAVKTVVKWQVGKTYAVQPGRGKHSIGRICIASIRREDRRDISDEDARAEGFKNAMAFLETWVAMHDKSVARTIESWIILANIDGRGYGYPMPADIKELLSRRPAERYDAWVITFTAEAQP